MEETLQVDADVDPDRNIPSGAAGNPAWGFIAGSLATLWPYPAS